MGKKQHQEFGHITVKSIRADTFSNLPSSASIDHTNLALLAILPDADIPSARTVAVGSGIGFVDGGPGGIFQINADASLARSAPQYILNSADVSLPNSRTLIAGTRISFVDGGPGGTLTVNSSGIGQINNVGAGVSWLQAGASDAGPIVNMKSIAAGGGISLTGGADDVTVEVDSTVAPSDPQYILFTGDGALTNARTLIAGTNVNFVDGGGGGPLTINVPSGGPDAPNTAQYVTLATDAGLTSERVLQGTVRQITVTDNITTVDLSLPAIIAPNAGFVYSSTGVDSDLLVLGNRTLSGADNKTNSIVLDTNVSALLEKAVVATNSTVAGGVFASLVCGGGSNTFTSTNVCSRGIVAGDGFSITGSGQVVKSLAVGAATITANVENSLVYGEGITISAAIDRSAVLGSGCTAAGVMQTGAMISGYNNALQATGTLTLGGFAIGREIDIINPSQAYHSGARIRNETTGIGNQMIIAAGVGATAGKRFSGTLNRYTFTDATLGLRDMALVASGKIHIASETAPEFFDSRPQCDESSLPTTNANDLISKAYAETCFVMTRWLTSAAGSGSFYNTGTSSLAYAVVATPIPVATQLQDIYVSIQNAIVSGALTVEIYKNGIATGVTVVISSGTSGSTTAAGLSFAAGDTFAPFSSWTGTAPGHENVSLRFSAA